MMTLRNMVAEILEAAKATELVNITFDSHEIGYIPYSKTVYISKKDGLIHINYTKGITEEEFTERFFRRFFDRELDGEVYEISIKDFTYKRRPEDIYTEVKVWQD